MNKLMNASKVIIMVLSLNGVQSAEISRNKSAVGLNNSQEVNLKGRRTFFSMAFGYDFSSILEQFYSQ